MITEGGREKGEKYEKEKQRLIFADCAAQARKKKKSSLVDELDPGREGKSTIAEKKTIDRKKKKVEAEKKKKKSSGQAQGVLEGGGEEEGEFIRRCGIPSF